MIFNIGNFEYAQKNNQDATTIIAINLFVAMAFCEQI